LRAFLAFQNPGFFEALENLFQVAGGNVLAAGNFLDLYWQFAGVEGHVEQGSQAVAAFGG
jgi:hypothetical protein